ncbi:hypothetical protein ABS71_10490 [bacterium SCN 62-11]|nr:MAG: hypothetical protein ABS71_10490 [bacterium SCN 62-11]
MIPTPESISFDAVPHAAEVLPTLRQSVHQAFPDIHIEAVAVDFATVEHAIKLVHALAEHCCVTLFIQEGELLYGPDEFVTEKNLSLLILWRLPILAAISSGAIREMSPDLENLGKELEDSLYAESLEHAISLSSQGRQRVLDSCAVKQGWTTGISEQMQVHIEEHWPVLSGQPTTSGFPEQMLIDLGLTQGVDWSYTLQDGKMQTGLSLSGMLKLVDQCAAEQGWTDKARDDYKAELEERWPV